MVDAIVNRIKKLILSEIKGDYSITNAHGVDLKKCLVEPYLQKFEKSFKKGEMVDVYIVLEENPESKNGHQIIYDPQEKIFGLGLSEEGKYHLLLGYYDTFLESLNGM